MGLSNAERQKRWRQRQKEKDIEGYRRNERERKRQAYVPHHLLSPEKLNEQRIKDRLKAKRKYQRQKLRQAKNADSPTISRVTRSSEGNNLTVKMSFLSKSSTARKRYKTALRAAYRQIKELTSKNSELQTEIKRERKRIQKQKERLCKASPRKEIANHNNNNNTSVNEQDITNRNTPLSKTKLILRKAGLKLHPRSEVFKQLVFGNAVVESLKSSLKKYKTKYSKNQMLALDVIRKYRCMNTLSNNLGVDRKKIRGICSQRLSRTMKQKYGATVTHFLEREDNSTVLPGKKDSKTVNKVVHQKHVLNDYLHNIYAKFIAENPQAKISKTQFCRLRPSHILLTCFSSRRTCLCTYHQNFSLKIKTLRTVGITCSANPDAFLREFRDDKSVEDTLENKLESNKQIHYKHWKKVQHGEKLKWKEIEETTSKENFTKIILNELTFFRGHVNRIHNQYTEMRRLRQNLLKDEIVVWMDFAENFTCSSNEEVQSAYWTTDMISLHTMVVYSDSDVQSYVAISDVLTHNAAVVFCILQKLIPTLKERYPGLKKIHYLTDSPTSQYRNKTIFQIVCHHTDDFGVSARWNYLEVGHGKDPCDGLGGSVKRCADMAVRQGKCSIQDASEFHKWASSNNDSKVKYFLYTANDIKQAEEVINERPTALAVPGTMKLHTVVPIDRYTVAIRELSCYCCECTADVLTTHCSGWTLRHIAKKPMEEVPTTDNITEKENDHTVNATLLEKTHNTMYEKDSWVAAVYEMQWYIGQITDIDDDELLINFLTKSDKYSTTYKFPSIRDEIWIKKTDVLIAIESVEPTGKSRRCFKLCNPDQMNIETMFKQRVQN